MNSGEDEEMTPTTAVAVAAAAGEGVLDFVDGDEEEEEDDELPPPSSRSADDRHRFGGLQHNNNHHQRSSTRLSITSASLYGPPVSSREGRPDYVQTLIEKKQQQQQQSSYLSSSSLIPSSSSASPTRNTKQQPSSSSSSNNQSIEVPLFQQDGPTETYMDEYVPNEQAEEEEEETRAAAAIRGVINSVYDDDVTPALEDGDENNNYAMYKKDDDDDEVDQPDAATRQQQQQQQRRHQQLQALRGLTQRRLSTLSDPKKLVRVALRDVSFFVPVDAMAPTKKTVINQSICYLAYQFFQRLGQLLMAVRPSLPNNDYDNVLRDDEQQQRQGQRRQQRATNNTKFVATSPDELFLPFSKRAILHKLNLVFEPGQTYLILGPPGCGKTTLLKTIAGRLPRNVVHWMDEDHQHRTKDDYKDEEDGNDDFIVGPQKGKPFLTGRIEYNGLTIQDEPTLCLPNIVSFVGQLDMHAPYLTVEETFEFARACREGNNSSRNTTTDPVNGGEAPTNTPDDAITVSENLTIDGLGLGHVRHTFVGNADVRGVSGGQRRRVTVGEMMQGQNPVACADEISTGLDAAVTYDIVKSIVDFAQAVKTTRIVSLLQPGPETFSLFDQLVLLAEGHVAYAGPVGEAIPYFATLGYALPATMDAADFLQAVTTPDGELLFNADDSPRDAHYSADEFAQAFRESSHGQAIQSKLNNSSSPHDWTGAGQRNNDIDEESAGGLNHSMEPITRLSKRQHCVPEEFKVPYQNSMIESIQLNFHRHLTLWWRDKGFIIGKTCENIGMAVATGGILFGQATIPDKLTGFLHLLGPGEDLPKDQVDALVTIQDAVFSAFFMTCLHILLGTTTSTPDDIDGRPIHYKQADANFYQTPAFVIGRLASTLPQRALEIVAFGIPLYFMVGLDRSARGFFIYLAIVLTFTFTLKVAYGIIAQVFPNKANVLGFGTFLVLLFSLFSGFIVFPDTIPTYLDWLYYSNPMAWALQGLLISEFSSDKYSVLTENGLDTSILFLKDRGFHTNQVWVGYTFVFLIAYAMVSAIILSLVLKYVRIEPTRATVQKREGKVFKDTEEDTITNQDIDGQQGNNKDFNFPFTPVDLTFENLCYEVKPSTGEGMLRLLNNVSGSFKAGRMCALMGSSGAGKTTLMDVIALRKESGVITGEIRMNGFPQDRTSFLRSSGYVEQFDVQQAELTVRETVMFSARLRLDSENPMTSTDKSKRDFVDYVLGMMELLDIQGLQVGSYAYGGLTFEQRKRLAIAVELAASPSVIFLDEPTSGLDSRGALVIMRAMKKIANTGRTVCATIHQPSSAVFEMFDDLLLLKRGGEVVFFGELGEESCKLVDYFESHGARPIGHGENPAAWMLRAYTGEDKGVDWKAAFEQSSQYEATKQYIESIKVSPDESKKVMYEHIYAAGWRKRYEYMNRRILTIMARAPSYNLARLMIAILYAFIIGVIFIEGTNSVTVFTENEAAGIFATMFLGLTIIGVVSISMAVPVMKDIRDVFYKHRASGMLNHNSVTLAITLGELPYIILMSGIFSSVYYASVDLFNSADRWLAFFGYFALNVASYVYFGQAFIALVKDTPTAGALVGALIGYNVFFSGLVVRPQYFTGPFQLGYWTAPGRFAFEGVIVSQFVDLDVNVIASPLGPFYLDLQCTDVTEVCLGTMTQFVEFYFGGRFQESHQGLCIGVLFFCLLLARLLCWVALWKFNYVNT